MFTKKIKITGRVQGVGFRPFVYRIAHKYDLKGWVRNTNIGVDIVIQGKLDSIEKFLHELQNNPPPLSKIKDILIHEENSKENFDKFIIIHSKSESSEKIIVSPDLAICSDCQRELFDKNDRRYLYPFINCTNCGPRFTIVIDVPYDRSRTTMNSFKMCSLCENEYENPSHRRFHAQPNACYTCGPQIKFMLCDEINNIKVDNIFRECNNVKNDEVLKAVKFLKSDKIVAIKGIGGYHLACDAFNNDAVVKLRKRKIREAKPFAIMVIDIKTAHELCEISPKEEEILLSPEKPIVLLKKKNRGLIEKLSDSVAPNNPFLGIMLPYTPTHCLLFREGITCLVMTSGNQSQEPIYFDDEEAIKGLSFIADAFLIHNRPIKRRCDDSVVRIFDDKLFFLRRARGYAPEPVSLNFQLEEILAVGAELKSTFAFSKGADVYISHHLGDLENFETLKAFEEGIKDFQNLFDLKYKYVVYDKHPDYLSSKFALNLPEDILKIPVQHHHAHIAACMAEYNINEEVIGVAFDGTGFGDDDTVWGGEFLVCDYKRYERVGHFNAFPLVGGEQAVKEPWRIASWWIDNVIDTSQKKNIFEKILNENQQKKWEILKTMLKKGIHSPLTSSIGRLFDAVSAILGICHHIDYEGQAAIELEYNAWKSDTDEYIKIKQTKDNYKLILDPSELLKFLILNICSNKYNKLINELARIFHNSMSHAIFDSVNYLREKYKMNKVILSGGCFQNLLLLDLTMRLLKTGSFEVYTNNIVPPNDGCISLGQIAVANAIIKSQ